VLFVISDANDRVELAVLKHEPRNKVEPSRVRLKIVARAG
jgi:hypothetical protein